MSLTKELQEIARELHFAGYTTLEGRIKSVITKLYQPSSKNTGPKGELTEAINKLKEFQIDVKANYNGGHDWGHAMSIAIDEVLKILEQHKPPSGDATKLIEEHFKVEENRPYAENQRVLELKGKALEAVRMEQKIQLDKAVYDLTEIGKIGMDAVNEYKDEFGDKIQERIDHYKSKVKPDYCSRLQGQYKAIIKELEELL